MKILNEFVPTRKFLKLADEIKDLVDGWNVTDSAGGFPAASGVVVSCILKNKYPEKYVCPIFILHYKGPVEVGGLALASDIIGLDGLAVTMGDKPAYGEPIKMLPSSEAARDFIREKIKTKNLKLGCLLTARVSAEDAIKRAQEPWDFIYFMRLEDKSLPILQQVSAACKKMNKPLYAYFLVGTEKNVETVKRIGWPVAATRGSSMKNCRRRGVPRRHGDLSCPGRREPAQRYSIAQFGSGAKPEPERHFWKVPKSAWSMSLSLSKSAATWPLRLGGS